VSKANSYRLRPNGGRRRDMHVLRHPSGREHAGIHLEDEGWVVRCPCGFVSRPLAERSHAEQSRGGHTVACPLREASALADASPSLLDSDPSDVRAGLAAPSRTVGHRERRDSPPSITYRDGRSQAAAVHPDTGQGVHLLELRSTSGRRYAGYVLVGETRLYPEMASMLSDVALLVFEGQR
jgi:hypothetical protein